MTPQQTTLQAIARLHLNVETLRTRNSDSQDFHDLAVWAIESALNAAFEAGKQQACGSCQGATK